MTAGGGGERIRERVEVKRGDREGGVGNVEAKRQRGAGREGYGRTNCIGKRMGHINTGTNASTPPH